MPIRTCAGCRAKRHQEELLRVVRRPDGSVRVDLAGSKVRLPDSPGSKGRARIPGRGAYLCRDRSCLHEALRSGSLARALRLSGGLERELVTELERTIGTPSGGPGRSKRRHGDGEAQGSRGR